MHSDPVVLAGGVGTDLPTWEEAFEQAQKLPHHSAVAFTNTISEAAYKTVPVSYILTEKDVVVSAGTYNHDPIVISVTETDCSPRRQKTKNNTSRTSKRPRERRSASSGSPGATVRCGACWTRR